MDRPMGISPERCPLARIVGGLMICGLAAFAVNAVQAEAEPKVNAKTNAAVASRDDHAVTGNRAHQHPRSGRPSPPPGPTMAGMARRISSCRVGGKTQPTPIPS